MAKLFEKVQITVIFMLITCKRRVCKHNEWQNEFFHLNYLKKIFLICHIYKNEMENFCSSRVLLRWNDTFFYHSFHIKQKDVRQRQLYTLTYVRTCVMLFGSHYTTHTHTQNVCWVVMKWIWEQQWAPIKYSFSVCRKILTTYTHTQSSREQPVIISEM